VVAAACASHLCQQVDVSRGVLRQRDQLVGVKDCRGVQVLGYAVLDQAPQLVRVQGHWQRFANRWFGLHLWFEAIKTLITRQIRDFCFAASWPCEGVQESILIEKTHW
jgi:hypothetical protein